MGERSHRGRTYTEDEVSVIVRAAADYALTQLTAQHRRHSLTLRSLREQMQQLVDDVRELRP